MPRDVDNEILSMVRHGFGVDDMAVKLRLSPAALADRLHRINRHHDVGPWLRIARSRAREAERKAG